MRSALYLATLLFIVLICVSAGKDERVSLGKRPKTALSTIPEEESSEQPPTRPKVGVERQPSSSIGSDSSASPRERPQQPPHRPRRSHSWDKKQSSSLETAFDHFGSSLKRKFHLKAGNLQELQKQHQQDSPRSSGSQSPRELSRSDRRSRIHRSRTEPLLQHFLQLSINAHRSNSESNPLSQSPHNSPRYGSMENIGGSRSPMGRETFSFHAPEQLLGHSFQQNHPSAISGSSPFEHGRSSQQASWTLPTGFDGFRVPGKQHDNGQQ